MRKKLDLTGKTFGRLTAIEEAGRANKYVLWRCRCACGKESLVRSSALARGEVQSCGCLISEKLRERNYKHGGGRSRLYRIWTNMHYRCECEDSVSYRIYGGRGISICDAWGDFSVFRGWAIANGYSDELTLDRTDNDGPYSPENCRWVTRSAQARNTRRNFLVEGKTLAEYCEEHNLKYSRVYSRLRKGWSLGDASKIEKWGKHECPRSKEVKNIRGSASEN